MEPPFVLDDVGVHFFLVHVERVPVARAAAQFGDVGVYRLRRFEGRAPRRRSDADARVHEVVPFVLPLGGDFARLGARMVDKRVVPNGGLVGSYVLFS